MIRAKKTSFLKTRNVTLTKNLKENSELYGKKGGQKF